MLDSIKVHFCNAVLKCESMVFFDNCIKAVCKIDTGTFEVTVLACFRNGKHFEGRKIFAIQERYYITERGSANILVYDGTLEINRQFQLYIPPVEYYDMEYKEYETYEFKNRIYFIPLTINKKIFYFDTDIKKYFVVFGDGQNLLIPTGTPEKRFGLSCLYKNEVWLPIFGTKFYVKYNLEEETSEISSIKVENATMSGICFDGKDIWIAQKAEKYAIYDEKKQIHISLGQVNVKMYNTKEFIILSHVKENKLNLIRKDKSECVVVDLPLNNTELKKSESWDLGGCCETDAYILLFFYGDKDLYLLDKKAMLIREIKLQCENYKKYYLDSIERAIDENKDLDLRDYLRFMKSNIGNLHKKELCSGTGKKIWANIDGFI